MSRSIICPKRSRTPARSSNSSEGDGRTGLSIPGDLRDEAFCQRLVDEAVRGLGGLDILVMQRRTAADTASILDLSTEDFDATMKTNIYAPFWIIKAALPHLPPGSTIIATTSEQAYDPSPDLYDYAQTKAATMNYVKSLAKQLAAKGIRVNGVAPGPIWTPLQVSGGATMEKVEKFGGQTPLGRPGPAGGAWLDLCPAGRERCKLCDRAGIRFVGWRRTAVSLDCGSAGILATGNRNSSKNGRARSPGRRQRRLRGRRRNRISALPPGRTQARIRLIGC